MIATSQIVPAMVHDETMMAEETATGTATMTETGEITIEEVSLPYFEEMGWIRFGRFYWYIQHCDKPA